jgi:site-specific DNA recombinase
LTEAERLRNGLLSDVGRAASLKAVIDRVELGVDSLQITLALASLVRASAQAIGDHALTREVPLRIRRRGVEMKLILDAPGPNATSPDPVLLKEIRRAHRCFDALVSGRVKSVVELATIEGVSDRYVSRLLPLAFLAPDIVEAIAAGRQPAEVTTHRLLRHFDLPTEWSAQRRLLGFA